MPPGDAALEKATGDGVRCLLHTYTSSRQTWMRAQARQDEWHKTYKMDL